MRLFTFLALFVFLNPAIGAEKLLFHQAKYDVYIKGTSGKVGEFIYRIFPRCDRVIIYNNWELDLPDAGKLTLNQNMQEDINSYSAPFKSIGLIIKNGETIARKTIDVKIELGKPDTAYISDGEQVTHYAIPKGLLYPVQYQRELIKTAFKNKKSFTAFSIDDGDLKVKEVNSIILGDANPGSLKSTYFKKPPKRIVQNIRAPGQTDNNAEATILFDLYENGASDNISIKIGAINLVARMTDIEQLKPEKCK